MASTESASENPNLQKETNGDDSEQDLGYEKLREKRINENKLRMQNLGLVQLSRNLKPLTKKPDSKSSQLSGQKALKAAATLLQLLEPSRRSSRLESTPRVSYKELREKSSKKERIKREICIPEGDKPEIYTEEHDKLLGECNSTWTLCVDGYGTNGKRAYDPVEGETCHQCRQKTLGLHTHCSRCDLVQGQLCGDCLYMRYGEHVIEANNNPTWICLVCRGICNCSLCRKARGWEPTGNLYRKVINLGFKSVAHYLIQTRRSQPISEDQDSVKSSSLNETSLIDESILPEDEKPNDNKADKIKKEDRDDMHLLVNNHVSDSSDPQPKCENVNEIDINKAIAEVDVKKTVQEVDDDGLGKRKRTSRVQPKSENVDEVDINKAMAEVDVKKTVQEVDDDGLGKKKRTRRVQPKSENVNEIDIIKAMTELDDKKTVQEVDDDGLGKRKRTRRVRN